MDENKFTGGMPPEMAAFWTDYTEKKRIHRTAWAVTAPGLVFFAVSFFISAILVFIGTRAGLSTEKIREIVSEPAANEVLQIILSLLLMTVPFIAFSKLDKFSVSRNGGFNRPKKGTTSASVMFGLGFCAFANIAVSAAGELFRSFGFHSNVPESAYPEGVFGFLLAVISTAIVPGLVEEFAFRGIVLGLLRPYGDAFAIVSSAAVFGILHGNFEQMPFAFLVGLALGFIRIKSGSLIVCMVIHAANNLIAVLLSFANDLSVVATNICYTVYLLLALTAAVLGILFLKGKVGFSFPAPERRITARKTYVYFFFSPAMILFMMVFLFRALTFVLF